MSKSSVTSISKTSLDREKTLELLLVSPNILRSLVYRTYIHYVVTAQYSERRYIIGQEARIFSKCARRNAWPQVEKNRIVEFLAFPFTKKVHFHKLRLQEERGR